jgi:hypothetical protein
MPSIGTVLGVTVKPVSRTWYRQAMIIAEEIGMRPMVAHCRLGLGKLYGRVGRRGEASEYLASATGMYRDMDMRFWLQQAEAEAGRL